MEQSAAELALSRATTRPIEGSDRGRRTADLDLALYFDPEERRYHKRGDRAAEPVTELSDEERARIEALHKAIAAVSLPKP